MELVFRVGIKSFYNEKKWEAFGLRLAPAAEAKSSLKVGCSVVVSLEAFNHCVR